MSQTQSVQLSASSAAVRQTGAKPQKAAGAETEAFASLLDDPQGQAIPAKNALSVSSQFSAVSRRLGGVSGKKAGSSADESDASSTSTSDRSGPVALDAAIYGAVPAVFPLGMAKAGAAASGGERTVAAANSTPASTGGANVKAKAAALKRGLAQTAIPNTDINAAAQAAPQQTAPVSAVAVSSATDLVPGSSLAVADAAAPAAPGATASVSTLSNAPDDARAAAQLQNSDVNAAVRLGVLAAPQQTAPVSAVVVSSATHLVPDSARAVADAAAQAAPGAEASVSTLSSAPDDARAAARLQTAARPASGTSSSATEDADAAAQPVGDASATQLDSAVLASAPSGKRGPSNEGGADRDQTSADDRAGAKASDVSLTAPVSAGSGNASTPSQQIFDAIESAAPPASADTPADSAQTASASLQPVKTISLALTPQNLGSVSIELSLKGGKLDVTVKAAEPETAQLLRRDNGALEKLLQSAGYTVQEVSIQASSQPAQPSQTGAQTAPGGQGSADPSNADGGRDQSRRQGSNDRPGQKSSDQRPTNGAPDYSGGGSLYV